MELFDTIIKLDNEIKQLSKKLEELPHLENGMYTNEMRETETFKVIDNELKKKFKTLQALNTSMSNKQKREFRTYKKERNKNGIKRM